MRSIALAAAAVLIVLAGVFLSMDSRAEGKTGFINLQRLVQNSEAGKQARQELENLRLQKQEQVQESLMELTRLRTEIMTSQAELSPGDLAEKREELERLAKSHNRLVEDVKEELQRAQNDLTEEILKMADEALKSVAAKKGYSVILKDPGVIGYLAPEADLTDEVLKQLSR
jgi:outer membrane protein